MKKSISISSKQLLKLESRSLLDLKKTVQFFFRSQKNNAYKRKGVFLKGFLTDIKISSKKSKF